MSYKEYGPLISDLIYLVICATEEKTPDAERVGRIDLSALYMLSERNLLTAIVAMALESAGIKDAAFTQAKGKAVRKAVMFDIERAEITAELEKSGIWYMPIKGSVLKDIYPKLGMRQMADNDILYDGSKTQELREIMEKRGYSVGDGFGKGVHDQYFKEPVLNFEMHRMLFAPSVGQKIYEYYSDPTSLMIRDTDSNCGRHFSAEDFYVYMIAHEYKHYSAGGTGLRSLLDTYLYLKKEKPDMNRVSEELEKLGIGAFEAKNRSLSLHLFGGETLTEQDCEMLRYILSSGTYGTTSNRIANQVNELGGGRLGKVKYLCSRIFLPMDDVKTAYPFFYKHKILMPFLVIFRLGKALTVRRAEVRAELEILAKREKK